MTTAGTHTGSTRSLRAPVLWGLVFGALQASLPLGFWWLDPSTVHALSIALIAAVYIGFAVADGRPKVIVVEVAGAGVFVGIAAAGGTPRAWRLVVGFARPRPKGARAEGRPILINNRSWRPASAAVS